MKKILLLALLPLLFLISCGKEDQPQPTPAPDPHAGEVKFTLYSKRVPYIWKRKVNLVWVQDTIRTNNAVVYEPFDTRNLGAGYWVTMNLAGLPTDSLHIKGEYNGRITQMSSPVRQSAAYVLLDNLQ